MNLCSWGQAARAVVIMLYLLPVLARAQEPPPPGHTRTLVVPKSDEPPVIDGKLDEQVWKKAAVADRFWISEQERWPTEKTEVLILADKENLYFGFRAYDSQPAFIEALQTRRDAGLGLDDQVVVELDPYHNHRHISSYSVNATGTQSDAIAGGRARKIEWKGDWKAAAARTEYGWSAEIAIPYAILNYRQKDNIFGVNFVRYHHRTDEWSRWADLTPQNKPEEMGHLTELELPEASKRDPWTFMPYVLAGRKVPDKEGKIHGFLGTAGIDMRYEPRQNITGVFSLNPDFSQIEKQITDINFSYTEKFRPDPRPFLQEGSAYFGSDNKFFYSNRVPDLDYGGKFFAQLGRFQLGGLVAEAPNSRWDIVFRLARELDATNFANMMIVGTERRDLKNQLLVGHFEGRQPYGLNYSLDSALSNTQEEKGDGGHVRASVGWRWDRMWIGTTLDHYSVNFLPANGLIKRDLHGTRGVSLNSGYYRDFAEGPIRIVSGDIGWTGRNTTDGLDQARMWYGGGSIELRQQVRMGLYYNHGTYRPVGEERGEWSDEVNDDSYWTTSLDFNTRSTSFGYGMSYSRGSLGGEDYRYLAPYLWMKPTRRTFIRVTTERLHSSGSSDQTIVTAGWDITKHDGIVMRYISANGDDYFRLAYSRQVRKGIDIFAVYDKEPANPAKISAKIVFFFP
jgi:hypothetical protein